MTIKQLKKRIMHGLIEPELFYMPVKNDDDAMIIKVSVTDINMDYIIRFHSSFVLSNIPVTAFSYKYSDMEQEYAETGTIDISKPYQYSNSVIRITPMFNFKLKDSSKVFITDDIDYFRNPDCDCLFKKCDDENITDILYSKCINTQPTYCTIDWGDGTIDNCDDLIQHSETDNYSYDIMTKYKSHQYKEVGEYYITIRGKIWHIDFNYFPFESLLEIVQWGNLGLYSIMDLYCRRSKDKIKMPKHISPDTFKNVLTANNAFYQLDMDENDFSHEIIFDFVNTFPNLLSATSMFYETKISHIPPYFCYNHKNIIDCTQMFWNAPITNIGSFAFANCTNLSSIISLIYSGHHTCFLTQIGDSVFENDINLVAIDTALNYIDDNIEQTYRDDKCGLKIVGNNLFKNCKRLRVAPQVFYQQTGLVTVGDSLFEGCDDLIDVKYMFWRCWSLQNIGKNIFKGCSKVRDFVCFFGECYFVNFPDNMLYDLKYYDYLKGRLNFSSFNGFWDKFVETNGIISSDNLRGICNYFLWKGINHSNFPTRKHSNNIFSESFVQECVQNNDVFWNRSCHLWDSMITIRNKISDTETEYYQISNFTGIAFPIWEYIPINNISDNSHLFGFRRSKVKRTHKKNPHTHTEIDSIEYGTDINHYDNYMEIATAEPLYYEIYEGLLTYWSDYKLLDTYYYPNEYENETGKQEVIEFNDPVEERQQHS